MKFLILLLVSLNLFAEDACEATKCLMNRIVSEDNKFSDEIILRSEKDVCRCLNSDKDFANKISYMVKPDIKDSHNKESTIQQIININYSLDEEMALNALYLESAKPDSPTIIDRFILTSKKGGNYFKEKEKSLAGVNKEDRKRVVSEAKKNNNLSLAERLNDFEKKKVEIKGQSCIDYLDYKKYKTTKISPRLRNYLKSQTQCTSSSTDCLEKDNWNYEDLLKMLDNPDLSDSHQIIKDKLVFLNRNPMIRSAFMGKADLKKGLIKFRNKIRNEMIKSLAVGDNENFLSTMKDFFNSDQIGKPVDENKKNERALRHIRENDDLNFKRTKRVLAKLSDDKNLKYQTYNDFVTMISARHRFDYQSKCNESTIDTRQISDCQLNMYFYCEELEKNFSKTVSTLPSESFEISLLSSEKINPEEDFEFQDLSKKICDKEFKSKNDPSQKMSFRKFKDECAISSSINCLDNDLLLREFQKQYNIEGDESVVDFNDYLSKTKNGPLLDNNKISLILDKTSGTKRSTYSPNESSGPSYSYDFDDDNSVDISEIEPVYDNNQKKLDSAKSSESAEVDSFISEIEKLSDPNHLVSQEANNFFIDYKNKVIQNNKEISEIKDQISDVKEDAKSVPNDEEKRKLEDKLKSLEELLAKKESLSQKYEETLKNLLAQKDKPKTEFKAPAPISDARVENTPSFAASSRVESNSQQVSSNSPAQSTASANFNSQGNTSNAFRAPASVAAIKNDSQVRLNAALLQANERKGGGVQTSRDGSITVGSVSETANNSLLVDQLKTGNIDLVVGIQDYGNFELNKIDMFSKYKQDIDKKLKDDQPTKIVVRSSSKEPLEFIAYREKGQIFFKPLRKTGASLEALRAVVKDQR